MKPGSGTIRVRWVGSEDLQRGYPSGFGAVRAAMTGVKGTCVCKSVSGAMGRMWLSEGIPRSLEGWAPLPGFEWGSPRPAAWHVTCAA